MYHILKKYIVFLIENRLSFQTNRLSVKTEVDTVRNKGESNPKKKSGKKNTHHFQ